MATDWMHLGQTPAICSGGTATGQSIWRNECASAVRWRRSSNLRLQFIRRTLTYADLSNDRKSGGALPEPFNERLLLLSLAAINFTTIVDFIIIMPLGPQYMRVFSISPAQFGIIVSSYAISAGISC